MNISVIVPLKNEGESLPELAAWIERAPDDFTEGSKDVWRELGILPGSPEHNAVPVLPPQQDPQ